MGGSASRQISSTQQHADDDQLAGEQEAIRTSTNLSRRQHGYSVNTIIKVRHVGGYVEEFDRPVTAREATKLHAKQYWVAKPDVFKVAAPHLSVLRPWHYLLPGHTYLLVPSRTLYRRMLRHSVPEADLSAFLQEQAGLSLSEFKKQQLNIAPAAAATHPANSESRQLVRSGTRIKDNISEVYDDDESSTRKLPISTVAFFTARQKAICIRQESSHKKIAPMINHHDSLPRPIKSPSAAGSDHHRQTKPATHVLDLALTAHNNRITADAHCLHPREGASHQKRAPSDRDHECTYQNKAVDENADCHDPPHTRGKKSQRRLKNVYFEHNKPPKYTRGTGQKLGLACEDADANHHQKALNDHISVPLIKGHPYFGVTSQRKPPMPHVIDCGSLSTNHNDAAEMQAFTRVHDMRKLHQGGFHNAIIGRRHRRRASCGCINYHGDISEEVLPSLHSFSVSALSNQILRHAAMSDSRSSQLHHAHCDGDFLHSTDGVDIPVYTAHDYYATHSSPAGQPPREVSFTRKCHQESNCNQGIGREHESTLKAGVEGTEPHDVRDSSKTRPNKTISDHESPTLLQSNHETIKSVNECQSVDGPVVGIVKPPAEPHNSEALKLQSVPDTRRPLIVPVRPLLQGSRSQKDRTEIRRAQYIEQFVVTVKNDRNEQNINTTVECCNINGHKKLSSFVDPSPEDVVYCRKRWRCLRKPMIQSPLLMVRRDNSDDGSEQYLRRSNYNIDDGSSPTRLGSNTSANCANDLIIDSQVRQPAISHGVISWPSTGQHQSRGAQYTRRVVPKSRYGNARFKTSWEPTLQPLYEYSSE